MEINEDYASKMKLQDIGRWYITNFVKSVAASLVKGEAILEVGAKKFFDNCIGFFADIFCWIMADIRFYVGGETLIYHQKVLIS